MQNEPTKPFLFSLLLCGIVSLLCLGSAEMVMRHFFEPFEGQEEERFIQPDSQLGWMNKPNFSSIFSSRRKGFAGTVAFDADGVRLNGTRARIENPSLKILLVGDSTTAGLEVDGERTFSSLLEDKIRQAGIAANVYNAGVRGFGTDQSLENLKRLQPILKPDVVIYLSCGNDFSDNLQIKNWYRPYSKPVYVLRDGELNLENSPTQQFPHGEYVFEDYSNTEPLRSHGLIKPDGVRGWLRDRSAIYGAIETLYYVRFSHTVFRVIKRNPKIEGEILAKLMVKMQSFSPRFFVTAFTKEKGGDGIGYDDVKSLASQTQIPFLDTQKYFKPGLRYDYVVDSHWNELGHSFEARAIYEELKAAHVFDKFNSLRRVVNR